MLTDIYSIFRWFESSSLAVFFVIELVFGLDYCYSSSFSTSTFITAKLYFHRQAVGSKYVIFSVVLL